MIIIGIILALVGLAYLCWLLFALAVHALPLFAGLTVGLAAYHGGSGPIGAIIVGAIALLFAVPAAVAGYHAALSLAHIAIPAEGWQNALAVGGTIIVAATGWARVALCVRPVRNRALPPA
jgi:hypothetical protein